MSDAPLSDAQPVRTKKAPSLKTTWSKAMRKSNLIPAVKNTASAACEYANSKTGARIFPGVDALSQDTGQSRRTIISHMDILEKSGWLKCLMRGKGAAMVDGKRLASEYQLAFPDPDNPYVGKGTVTYARAGQAARKARREAEEASGQNTSPPKTSSATLPLETSEELAQESSEELAPVTSATLPTPLTHPELYTQDNEAAPRQGAAAAARAELKARIAKKKAATKSQHTAQTRKQSRGEESKQRPADTLTETLGRKPSTIQVRELENLLQDGWELSAACVRISEAIGTGSLVRDAAYEQAPVGAVAGV